MISQNKKVYFCQFCRKHYLREDSCLKHEQICSKNPLNKHLCYCCKYNVETEDTIPIDLPDGTQAEKKFKSFFCEKLNCFICSRKAVVKKYGFAFGETGEIYQQMKNKCQFYKDKYI